MGMVALTAKRGKGSSQNNLGLGGHTGSLSQLYRGLGQLGSPSDLFTLLSMGLRHKTNSCGPSCLAPNSLLSLALSRPPFVSLPC